MPHVPEITPIDLKAALDGPIPPMLIDVREAFEIEIASIDPHVAIPIGQIVERLAELDRNTELVIVCHSGMRSAQVTAFLCRQGYERVRNLAGGVDRWALEVDPTMRRY